MPRTAPEVEEHIYAMFERQHHNWVHTRGSMKELIAKITDLLAIFDEASTDPGKMHALMHLLASDETHFHLNALEIQERILALHRQSLVYAQIEAIDTFLALSRRNGQDLIEDADSAATILELLGGIGDYGVHMAAHMAAASRKNPPHTSSPHHEEQKATASWADSVSHALKASGNPSTRGKASEPKASNPENKTNTSKNTTEDAEDKKPMTKKERARARKKEKRARKRASKADVDALTAMKMVISNERATIGTKADGSEETTLLEWEDQCSSSNNDNSEETQSIHQKQAQDSYELMESRASDFWSYYLAALRLLSSIDKQHPDLSSKDETLFNALEKVKEEIDGMESSFRRLCRVQIVMPNMRVPAVTASTAPRVPENHEWIIQCYDSSSDT